MSSPYGESSGRQWPWPLARPLPIASRRSAFRPPILPVPHHPPVPRRRSCPVKRPGCDPMPGLQRHNGLKRPGIRRPVARKRPERQPRAAGQRLPRPRAPFPMSPRGAPRGRREHSVVSSSNGVQPFRHGGPPLGVRAPPGWDDASVLHVLAERDCHSGLRPVCSLRGSKPRRGVPYQPGAQPQEQDAPHHTGALRGRDNMQPEPRLAGARARATNRCTAPSGRDMGARGLHGADRSFSCPGP